MPNDYKYKLREFSWKLEIIKRYASSLWRENGAPFSLLFSTFLSLSAGDFKLPLSGFHLSANLIFISCHIIYIWYIYKQYFILIYALNIHMIVNQHRMPLTAVCQHGRVILRAELFCNLRKLLMEVERLINVIMK